MLSKPLMQLSTCSIQLRLKIFQHLHLTFTIQKLHFRCLEQEKLDCLVNDISIKNELSADRSHILRVPE